MEAALLTLQLERVRLQLEWNRLEQRQVQSECSYLTYQNPDSGKDKPPEGFYKREPPLDEGRIVDQGTRHSGRNISCGLFVTLNSPPRQDPRFNVDIPLGASPLAPAAATAPQTQNLPAISPKHNSDFVEGFPQIESTYHDHQEAHPDSKALLCQRLFNPCCSKGQARSPQQDGFDSSSHANEADNYSSSTEFSWDSMDLEHVVSSSPINDARDEEDRLTLAAFFASPNSTGISSKNTVTEQSCIDLHGDASLKHQDCPSCENCLGVLSPSRDIDTLLLFDASDDISFSTESSSWDPMDTGHVVPVHSIPAENPDDEEERLVLAGIASVVRGCGESIEERSCVDRNIASGVSPLCGENLMGMKTTPLLPQQQLREVTHHQVTHGQVENEYDPMLNSLQTVAGGYSHENELFACRKKNQNKRELLPSVSDDSM